ncbi:Cytosolic sulfotransferase 17 [Camellia lanceoleosa]|uniref:Cytosolic sulfotransferase 17 n=1 Tax=Camellia lanceoleosa TaxID=1840588 RepID=A0ACC0GLK4_9ERIC|nr:Cytosolic sulfotransferase 17 [Camellia lanceoleosa]
MASPRLFRTHISYSLLPQSFKTSSCKIVYITRDPKDVFVSLWHFMNTKIQPEQGPFPFDEAFESFCNGVHLFGPFHEHVLFLKYADLKRDPRGEVKKLASFLGRLLADDGEAEKIVRRCSMERLKNLEVNKDGVDPWSGFPKSSYFRLGIVGDWKNKLTTEMKDKLDEITRVKFEGSGLSI